MLFKRKENTNWDFSLRNYLANSAHFQDDPASAMVIMSELLILKDTSIFQRWHCFQIFTRS